MRYRKRSLWQAILKNINYSVHNLHVIAIINILIEEILKELKAGKEVRIENFGTFVIRKMKPKKIHSVNTGIIKFAKTMKLLRFVLPKHISKYLSKEELKEQCQKK